MTRDEALARLTAPGAPFEMAAVEVGGIPMRVYAGGPTSLRGILESSRNFGDRDYLVYGQDRVTFEQHFSIVAGLARWLADERDIQKGDRVAIGMRNYPEWVMAFWATQVLGAVVVPLNAWWTAPELRYALDDSGARFAVLDGERYDRMVGDLDELGLSSLVVRPRGVLHDGAVVWGEVFERLDRTAPLPDVVIAPDDPSTIIYTSGTTGSPKGALGTHRNHVTNYLNTALAAAVQRMTSPAPEPAVAEPLPPAALQTYPFFHIGGLSIVYLWTGFGTKLVLQYKWDLEEALDLIERERVTSLAAVPTLLRQVLESPDLEARDLSSLTSIASGGTPVPPDLVRLIAVRFGVEVAPGNGYGLTETSSGVTSNRGDDYVARPSSVGRVVGATEICIVDPGTGDDVPAGGIGEIWFRGPTIVAGYWNKPEATAEAFTDGWFHTGDLGSIDDEGFVYVVDRLKDVVIRGGENVYCAEVEAVLFEHPAVADVAIVGVPHRELGEQVAAIVRLKAGETVEVSDLQDHVRGRLAHFKVPEVVVFRTDELPRTATGKVIKRDLRDELLRDA
jgi:long-chain acyl-CoA synthetase